MTNNEIQKKLETLEVPSSNIEIWKAFDNFAELDYCVKEKAGQHLEFKFRTIVQSSNSVGECLECLNSGEMKEERETYYELRRELERRKNL